MIRITLFVTLFFLFRSSFSQTVSAEDSKNYIGKTITIAGKVVDGRYLLSSGRQPTLLNIDKAFPNQIFSIVIYGEQRKAFGYKPEETLLNKNILVTGKVELFKGIPQINVTNPDQIVIASGTETLPTGNLKATGTGDVQIKSAVKLRAGPGNDFKLVTKLKAGSTIQILHSDNGWSYISAKKNSGKKDKDLIVHGFIKTEELK